MRSASQLERVARPAMLAATVLAAGALGAACGAEATPTAITVAATDGAELFEARALGGEPGCVTCHSLDPGTVLVGPSLADPATSAAAAGAADARAYVRQSILEPTAHVVPGFEDARPMPPVFGQVLTDEQVEALVDYVLEVDDDR